MANAAREAPSAPAARMMRGRTSLDPTRVALGVLILLVLVNAWSTPNFATTSNLWNVLLQVSTVALVAIGMTLVVSTGGIDLSVGSVMAVGGAIGAILIPHGVVVAVAAALAGAVAIGLLNGLLVARMGVQPIVVTLATLIGGRGLAQVLSHDGQLVTIQHPGFELLGRGHVGPFPAPVVIMVLVAAVAMFTLRATAFGRYALASGGNPVAARLAGVPVALTVLTVYAGSAGLAGLAGLIEASRLGASDAAKIGMNMELDAIAATVVGGTALTGGRATIVGTVIGALIMQVIATSLNMLLVSYAWSLALKAAIILVAVYFQRPRLV
jgi:galactofuranose transport system permease protein